jgi:hypothetical protein
LDQLKKYSTILSIIKKHKFKSPLKSKNKFIYKFNQKMIQIASLNKANKIKKLLLNNSTKPKSLEGKRKEYFSQLNAPQSNQSILKRQLQSKRK